MAIKTGVTMNIQIDDSTGSLVDMTAYANKIDFGFPTDMLDTTGFGSSSKSFMPGFAGGDDVQITFRYDPTIEVHLAQLNRVTSTSTILISPEGTAAGAARYSIETYLMDTKIASSPAAINEIVATFRKTGAVARDAWPSGSSMMLLESGFSLLLESGDHLLLEV